MFGFRRRRRAKLLRQPLPAAWWQLIDERVPYVNGLAEQDRRELAGIIQVLLEEKRFEGCGGLEMTDEIRVTIAAQAAVLLLHRQSRYYPSLKTILVYPHSYISNMKRVQPDGTIVEGPQPRLGESWFRGALVLSWDDVLQGEAIPPTGTMSCSTNSRISSMANREPWRERRRWRKDSISGMGSGSRRRVRRPGRGRTPWSRRAHRRLRRDESPGILCRGD